MALLLLLLLATISVAAAVEPKVRGGRGPAPAIRDNPGEQIGGPPHPEDAASVTAWRASLVSWKTRMLAKIHYNGSIYDVPQLEWTQTSYVQPQMHPCARAAPRSVSVAGPPITEAR